MDLKRPLVVLAVAGVLAGCAATETGGNTDIERDEVECNAAEAGASEQQLCEDAETDNEQQTDEEDDGVS